MKRIKKVHSTDQLMHLFCNMINGHLEGFKNTNGNVCFQDRVLYSYGFHYPMAAKYQTGEGYHYREVILVNSNRSSNTTEKHKYKVRKARTHAQWLFNVPNVKDPQDSANTDELLNQIADVASDVLSGLKHSGSFYDKIDNFNRYTSAFKIKKTFKLDLDFELILNDLKCQSITRWERLDAKNQNLRDIQRKKNLESQKDLINRTHSNLHLWLTSTVNDLTPSSNDLSILSEYLGHDLVKIKNESTLVTQRGAEVPISSARVMLESLKVRGSHWLVGQSIGDFTVDAASDDILTIGCHKISIKQVSEVLK